MTRDGRRYSVSRSGLCTWVSNAYTFIYVHITQTHTHTLNTIFKKKQLLHSFYLQPRPFFLNVICLAYEKSKSLELANASSLIVCSKCFPPLFNDILLTVCLFSINNWTLSIHSFKGLKTLSFHITTPYLHTSSDCFAFLWLFIWIFNQLKVQVIFYFC